MTQAANSQPTVAIALCTYNGEQHLEEQLSSFVAQTWPVAVRVFDDASSDNTLKIIESFKDKLDLKIHINDKNLGYVGNFENGVKSVLDENFNYIALSDQDDIWHADRIAKGMRAVIDLENTTDKPIGILAHSDLKMIDADKACVHQSFLKYRKYELNKDRDLAKVLGQNGVMGNTTLINRVLATMALPFPDALHVHDYWIAVLAELHGKRIFINEPLVEYRLHEGNASNNIGNTKFGVSKILKDKSLRGLLERDFRLPFKEDERLNVVDTLLKQPHHFPQLNAEQTEKLTVFKNYLVFRDSRLSLFLSMLRAGFFRKGLRHRLRLGFSTLLTKRY